MRRGAGLSLTEERAYIQQINTEKICSHVLSFEQNPDRKFENSNKEATSSPSSKENYDKAKFSR